jgi:hypothetical protein
MNATTTAQLDTTVTVGSGRSIHWGSDCGTICGAAHRNGFFTEPKLVKAEAATCKRCIKIMASKMEQDHADALAENVKHEDAKTVAAADVQPATVWVRTEDGAEVEVTRVAAHPFPRVSFRHLDGSTGTLPLPWFLERYTKAPAPEVAEGTAAPSDSYPAAVPLNTWLATGLVLVGPATDSLYTFQRWDGGTAVLLHLDTQTVVRIAQADIVNWRYLPGADAATLAEEARTLATPEAHASRFHAATSCVQGDACPFPHADRIKVGDRIQFVAGGDVWTVREVEHHTGTDLYSFGVRHSVRQFVRHSTEQVRRVVALDAR